MAVSIWAALRACCDRGLKTSFAGTSGWSLVSAVCEPGQSMNGETENEAEKVDCCSHFLGGLVEGDSLLGAGEPLDQFSSVLQLHAEGDVSRVSSSSTWICCPFPLVH